MNEQGQAQKEALSMDVLEIGLVPVYRSEDGEKLINGRELHDFLGDKQDFSTWIKAKLKKYGFVEGVDYLVHNSMEQLPSGAKHKIDYILKLDVAKEIAMVQNNERGREIRQYFIDIERRYQAAAERELAIYKSQDHRLVQVKQAAELSKADATMTQSAIRICRTYGIDRTEAALMIQKSKENGTFETDLHEKLIAIRKTDLQKKRDRVYVRAQRLGTYIKTACPDIAEPYEEVWHFLSDEMVFEAGTKKSLRKRHDEDKKKTEEANAGRKRGEPKVKCPGYLDYIQEGNLYKEAETVLGKLLRKWSRLAAKVEQANAAAAAQAEESAPAELA